MLRRLKAALLARPHTADRYVLVHYPVVAMMQKAVATCEGKPESGGILLGSIRGPHLEITALTVPAPADVRTMTRFVRQDRVHQAAADNSWKRSAQEIGFMGEWHTHPSGPPVPSTIDRASWAKLTAHMGHPMCFLLASPQGWRGFYVPLRDDGSPDVALAEYERGALGIVLR
ncbi:Mov34/MPN/PAD-1 family protein [Tardiphaga sp.]|jgi:integrative and conjugative element protein (TIGR02256 family)|uniref:Mov34/MPN/PAD-1 family protein n=1 Tax=Tardiphaga sp. TaxID=1926292 RepID=UPI0037D9DF69